MVAQDLRPPNALFFCLLTIVLVLSIGTAAISADSHVTLTIEESTAVPSENIEFEGDEYLIDAIAVRNQGETLTARVTLPDEEYTSVGFLLYNSNQQIEQSKKIRYPGTKESVSFDTDAYPPGTYMLNVELEGATEKIHPVVVPGYDITVDHAASASREDDLKISADVTQTALSSPPASVEVAVWNDTHTQTFELTRNSDTTYSTTVSLDQFSNGEYMVNVAALGNDTFRGQQEILALENSSLTIQNSTSDDDTDDSDSGGDDSQDSDDSTADGSDDEDSSSSDGDSSSSDEDSSSPDDDNSSSDEDSSSSDDDSTDSSDSDGDDDQDTNNSTGGEDDSPSGDDGSSEDEDTGDDGETSSGTDNTNATDDTSGSETNGSNGTDTTGSDSSDDVISPNQNTTDETTDDDVSLFAVQSLLVLLLTVIGVRRVKK